MSNTNYPLPRRIAIQSADGKELFFGVRRSPLEGVLQHVRVALVSSEEDRARGSRDD